MGDYKVSLGFDDQIWYLTLHNTRVHTFGKNHPTQDQIIEAVGYHQGLRVVL